MALSLDLRRIRVYHWISSERSPVRMRSFDDVVVCCRVSKLAGKIGNIEKERELHGDSWAPNEARTVTSITYLLDLPCRTSRKE
jgi:hypothetical protein